MPSMSFGFGEAWPRASLPDRPQEPRSRVAGLEARQHREDREQSYCIIAEWDSAEALANARPNMIATLNSFRDTLEDLGGGQGY